MGTISRILSTIFHLNVHAEAVWYNAGLVLATTRSNPTLGCCVQTPTQCATNTGLVIRVVTYRLWNEGLVRLTEVVVCLSCCVAGPTVPLSRAMDGCIMHRGISTSCQSAATSKIVKRC